MVLNVDLSRIMFLGNHEKNWSLQGRYSLQIRNYWGVSWVNIQISSDPRRVYDSQ